MARRPSLASMSVPQLLELRDEVGRVLRGKTTELHKQLAALGVDVDSGRNGRRKSAMKGKMVAPKFRGPGGETWAGRGAMPRWMTAAIKEGKKREDFLIDKSAAAPKRGRRKKK